MSTKPKLIAMMGLPRSGKSTIAEVLRLRYGAPIVRRDAIRLALHGQRFQKLAEPMVKATSLLMIRSLFLSGHPLVICDETNYSFEARLSLQDPSWDVEFYELHTEPGECKRRALACGQEDLIEVIDSMYARYDPLYPEETQYEYWKDEP